MIFHCIGKDTVSFTCWKACILLSKCMQREFQASQGSWKFSSLGRSQERCEVLWGRWALKASGDPLFPSNTPEILGRERESLGMSSHVVIPNTHKACEQGLLTRKFAEKVRGPYFFSAAFSCILQFFIVPFLTPGYRKNTSKKHKLWQRRNKKGMKSEEVMPTSREWPARKHGTAV